MPQQMQLNNAWGATDPIGGFSKRFTKLKMDVDSILVQRPTVATCTYHLLDDPKGHPVFTRPPQDSGRKFIFFNNPSFPPGSGHFLVLRKMENQGPAGYQQDKEAKSGRKKPMYLYETFSLNFRDSVHGTVTSLDPFRYSVMQNRLGLSSQSNRRRFGRGQG